MTKISVVTACYNAADYIDVTLRSVLDQGYDGLEYIVIDGGSDDGTQEIIERYRDRLAYYVSEPDGGQYEAIQKGLSRASGEVMCWLNADDIYLPWTLSVVGEIFAAHTDIDWITGQPAFLNRRGQATAVYGGLGAYPRRFIANGWYSRDLGGFLQQESLFWRRSLWDRAGGLDLSLRYAGDFELWTRFARHADLVPVAVPLAAFRKLPGQQRSSLGAETYDAEVRAHQLPPPRLWRLAARGGVIARSLTRLLIRRRGPAVLYDEGRDAWRQVTTRRPIARAGLQFLQQQFALRRAGKSDGRGEVT
ncbi:glycosyltransferase family 2 protein [Pseudodonghicola flavimaris]|uniref:Glycosyltransferase family 2 protein n=1 Tax=Pseudodonghicola flavimaris TaxID=3050036 RepID=A0ABT7F3T4_9RHOB|nr:glycosyltransferase family 2 protein [Pseudodonghicola flavimaris]MDK3019094.1 glycosyltransferase family 2 protein [Pseudodonghicola flavimaris]